MKQTFRPRLMLAALLASVLCIGSVRAAEPVEAKAITEAALSYMAANSAVAGPEIKIEAVQGNFARVAVIPKKGETDPATLFLVKKNGSWKGVLLGTAFAPEDYEEFHIPANIQAR